MIKTKLRSKSGATSFYVVAIATLILVILATSFATAIMAEIIRSANDDLAQSAYDSALAGVEEAKLAYENYRNCLNRGFTSDEPNGDGEISCPEIIYWMEHPDCDMVAHILGRIRDDEESTEINLEKTATGPTSDLDQAYTCVEIDIHPQDIYGSLGLSTPYKVISVNNQLASSIKTVVLKWHTNSNDHQNTFANVIDATSQKVFFPPISKMGVLPTPAVVSLQMVQTSKEGFTFDQLIGSSSIDASASNRATLYFIPTDSTEMASSSSDNYEGIFDGDQNSLSAAQVAASNNHLKNVPYVVYCDTDISEDFACSVSIELPSVIGGEERSKDTFSLIFSLPYGGPSTNYSISYICKGDTCDFSDDYTSTESIKQIIVDSTGRAGDMYKRVEVRLSTETSSFDNGYPFFAIQADDINKNFSVDNEWGIGENPPDPDPANPDPSCEREEPNIMQEWNSCSCLAVNETRTLTDSRDSQSYTITKLADNKCWMTTNLNLAGGTPLSSENTDMAPGYTLPTSLGFLLGNRLPASSTDGFNNDSKAFVYNSGRKTNCNSQPCYSYYSWPATTLGSAQDTEYGYQKAIYSICPNGWRLPTGVNSDSDYAMLITKYGGSSFNKYAGPGTQPNFLLTGYITPYGFLNGGDKTVGVVGLYQSSNVGVSGGYKKGLLGLFFHKEYASYESGLFPAYGAAVRCVKR